ncbi:hypothetical protein EV424DRAFT_1542948 [Suillus variegatus]|nr:hypothetical protein EV424DRAFT_1542948 [Suillus variegatus]
MDDTVKTEPVITTIDIKTEDSEVINNKIKTEDTKAEKLDGVMSLPTCCEVSPCNVLTRCCGNPNKDPKDLFAPWRYTVRPFDVSDIATEVAKRKKLFEEIENWGRKRL